MISILDSIYVARRDAASGTCLSALTDDQARTIADRIQADMMASNLQIADARPVDAQVADLTARLEQLREGYSKQITALSCARVLLQKFRHVISTPKERALLEEIGEPDIDDRALAHLVKTRAKE
ncbi:hypothetical protein [Azospirillum sp. TSO5]|uniref:hypothetical protein n=1 Tax=Azospirillum sp. TSO5 TaxID=716760 RepID=UPI000D60CB83|nr:hypothetical protein [Azospirillum sp. TSO5]PWC97709.1 hypothetical protein TSO5_04170 [Azospirillum sp. TSO5]